MGNFQDKNLELSFLGVGITEIERVRNSGQFDTERGKGKKTSCTVLQIVLTAICDT